ncbi:MAG: hypothetical protein WCQ80_00295 [Bacilli bacterium]
MKKLDYVLIILIFIIIGGFFIHYASRLFLDTTDAKVIVTYKNIQLDLVDYEDGLDVIYEVEVKSEEPTILIVKKTIGEITTIQTIVIAESTPIYNRIHVEYEHIYMEDANCDNKVCMRTYMSSTHVIPIVCTNGLIIEFMSKQQYIDEILVP